MTLLSFIFVLTFILGVTNAEVGCSDYGCICHPNEECHPAFEIHNPCQTTEKGCWGPVVATNFPGITVNRSVAKSMVPKGLEPIGVGDKYTLTLTFNQQHNVGTPEFDFNYLEFIVGMAVRWDADVAHNYEYKGPFAYGAKLYLDRIGPTVAGQAYGVNKEVTNMTQSCDMNGNCQYAIYAPGTTNELLMTAEWSPTG
eukprot:404039_1